jgi:putative transposase
MPWAAAGMSTRPWSATLEMPISRAIDRDGALVDLMQNKHRDFAAAEACFRSAKAVTGLTPDWVTTDGHDVHPRVIRMVLGKSVRHRTHRYSNSSHEQVPTSTDARL